MCYFLHEWIIHSVIQEQNVLLFIYFFINESLIHSLQQYAHKYWFIQERSLWMSLPFTEQIC